MTIYGLAVAAFLLAGCGAPPTDQAYVEATAADNPVCDATTPCGHLDAALATGAHEIHILGELDDHVTIARRAVAITGDLNSILTWSGSGPAIEIWFSHVEIRGLLITRLTDPNAAAILVGDADSRLTMSECQVWGNAGTGIEMWDGSFTLRDSQIAQNVFGGLEIQTSRGIDISNNDIHNNGSQASIVGGIVISSAVGTVNGNIVLDNVIQPGSTIGSAIHCVSPGVIMANNYVRGPEPTIYSGYGACGSGQEQVLR